MKLTLEFACHVTPEELARAYRTLDESRMTPTDISDLIRRCILAIAALSETIPQSAVEAYLSTTTIAHELNVLKRWSNG